VFFRDKKTGQLDSLVIPTDKFIKTSLPVFQASIPEYIYWSALLLLVIGFAAFVYTRLDRPVDPIFADFNQASIVGFSEIETSLIQLLIKKSKNQQRTDIHELNYVLGVKDKNIGLQKKVRSEAIHGINEKFRYMTGYENSLICSERSAADKRYFEYFIPKEMVRDVQAILNR
jgi:hypothetical protein